MRDKKILLVLGAFVIGVTILILLAMFGGQKDRNVANSTVQSAQPGGAAVVKDDTFSLTDIFGREGLSPAENNETWSQRTVEIIFRLLLAVILSGILAFRPRKDVPLFRRSLFVSQTQILLAVVAAALMMIVGDNAARAFAIFAAVSIVRFRTNIRDPKEVTVLLISLALGLAAGVGRWELGISLCLFALALLWLLEYNEGSQVFRSMELTIKTRDTDRTQEVLKKIFKRKKLDAEVRELDPPDEKDEIGRIVYYLNLRLNLTTDELSERILAADPHIERIQWSKTKAANDIYQ
jgi:uncharacterized membrane protein YhiD involved in acid resistance